MFNKNLLAVALVICLASCSSNPFKKSSKHEAAKPASQKTTEVKQNGDLKVIEKGKATGKNKAKPAAEKTKI
jgi:uncharacterized lipoprotein